LLHDDVIDDAKMRRSFPSANMQFSNKAAILSGDYLLASASVALAQIGRLEIVQLLATVIQDLVEGEMMQLNGISLLYSDMNTLWDWYMKKTFLKTASLLAKSCKAAAMLADNPNQETISNSFEFGKNLGNSFQIIDDLMDVFGDENEMGKPVGSDLHSSVINAPLLFALENDKELVSKLWENESFDELLDLLRKPLIIELTQNLAGKHLEEAMKNLKSFPDSPHKEELVNLSKSMAFRRR